MANANKILPNYTYDDYRQWEGKWEIIEGIPYAMSPSPSPRHQHIASRLNTLLDIEIRTKDCHCQVYHPIDIKITDNTVVLPDLSIVCAPINKPYLDFPPTLIVEILSPSTRDKDLITKFELYCDFGVKHYLIVDPENETITSYILDGVTYQKSKTPDTFELVNGCKIAPDFSTAFR